MNILFMTSAAPSKSPFFTDEKRAPLGIGYLISTVRNEGHKAFFIDNYLKEENIDYGEYLCKNNIGIVGIYANTICFQKTLEMLNLLQDLRNKKIWLGKIVVGGPHTTVAVHTIPEFVDHIVQGEGEAAIIDIINGTNEKIIRRDRIKNLDSIPFPAWDVFVKLPYDYDCKWLEERPVFTMNTSRGCPYGCSFCSVESIWGKKYTSYSAKRIISEIEYLQTLGAKAIYFREDNFTLDNKRVIEFCSLIQQKKMNFSWVCETRVDTLDKELIDIMSKSGCKAFYIGVESGSQKMLNQMNKNITLEHTRQVFKWAKDAGIKTYASCISGLPEETMEDLRDTFDFINKIQPSFVSVNVFVGIPDSREYKKVLDNKLYCYKDENDLLYLPDYNCRADLFYKGESSFKIPVDETNGFAAQVHNMKEDIKRRINSLIAAIKENKLKFAIYGAGLQTERILSELDFEGVEIQAIFDIDTSKHGKLLNGIKIHHPDKILEFDLDVILICLTWPGAAVYNNLTKLLEGRKVDIVRLYQDNELFVF